MQRMVRGRGSGKKPPSRCFVTKPAGMQGKDDGSGGGFASGKKELQERADAAGPGVFIVLGVWNQFEMQVVIVLPAAPDQRIAQRGNVLHGAGAFFGASIEPNARAGGFARRASDKIQNGSLISTDRWRQ